VESREMNMSTCPSDYYLQLPPQKQKVIDSWEKKKQSLTELKIRKAIDSMLNLNNEMKRSSKRFLRVHVKDTSRKNDGKNKSTQKYVDMGAILTIWNVSESQIECLKEGKLINFTHLDVKSILYDGMLQLVASTRTSMKYTYHQPSLKDLVTYGYRPRHYSSMTRFQIISKKTTSLTECPELDCMGYLLHVHTESIGSDKRLFIYLTDESGLVLRLTKLSCLNDAFMLQLFGGSHSKGQGMVICIRNIRIFPFDVVENCATGFWTDSTYHMKPSCCRSKELNSWANSTQGNFICSNLSHLLLNKFPCGNIPSSLKTLIGQIVGFINGVERDEGDLSTRWVVLIDCGQDRCVEAVIPLNLLHKIDHTLCDELIIESRNKWPQDNIQETDEINILLLGKRLRESGILFNFTLEEVKTEKLRYFEVKKIGKADSTALFKLLFVSAVDYFGICSA